MVPPERRLGPALESIEEGKYFTLTAGRQTGKTTSLRWLVAHYREVGAASAIWVDLQTAREEPDPAAAFDTILRCLDWSVETYLPDVGVPANRASFLAAPATALLLYLQDLARRAPRPLVVLFDEADGLVGKAMVSFLTQLRAGYIARTEQPFPRSVVLVGMRQVRDYALAEQDRRAVSWLGTTSPFNITADALTLPAFTRVDVEDLLAQHTAATGQRFEPDAVARVFDLSQGHPWLVNALADQAVRREVPDRAALVAAAHIEAAKERIILERRTHIDSLIAKLRDPRVRRILDPMIAGERTHGDTHDDDFAYVIGLGLLRRNNGTYEIANPIYREVIPRALTYVDQGQIQVQTAPFVRADGALDVPKLLAEWQAFWREDGHLAAEGFHYRESGPHLMLMAFLQRVVNGGGRIEREYALGRGALDLIIEWRGARHVIEVKVRRDTQTEERALGQVAAYLDSLGLAEGWLILFDLRSGKPWAERLWTRDAEHAGKRVHLVGC
jgi:type II secretory pathway predicted ATPase ExeA